MSSGSSPPSAGRALTDETTPPCTPPPRGPALVLAVHIDHPAGGSGGQHPTVAGHGQRCRVLVPLIHHLPHASAGPEVPLVKDAIAACVWGGEGPCQVGAISSRSGIEGLQLIHPPQCIPLPSTCSGELISIGGKGGRSHRPAHLQIPNPLPGL